MSKLFEKAVQQSRCVICKMRVQVNGDIDPKTKTINPKSFQWGHSRYPMDHPATPNRKAIKWHKRKVI